MDALNQDATGGGCVVSDDIPHKKYRPVRHPFRRDYRAGPHQSADRHLDAVHLLQGNPKRDYRSRANGWREHMG